VSERINGLSFGYDFLIQLTIGRNPWHADPMIQENVHDADSQDRSKLAKPLNDPGEDYAQFC
jgi:hypothetical protein